MQDLAQFRSFAELRRLSAPTSRVVTLFSGGLDSSYLLQQAALDRTRPRDVRPGNCRPESDILAWLTAL